MKPKPAVTTETVFSLQIYKLCFIIKAFTQQWWTNNTKTQNTRLRVNDDSKLFTLAATHVCVRRLQSVILQHTIIIRIKMTVTSDEQGRDRSRALRGTRGSFGGPLQHRPARWQEERSHSSGCLSWLSWGSSLAIKILYINIIFNQHRSW